MLNKRNIIAQPPTLLVALGLLTFSPTSCCLSNFTMFLKKLDAPLEDESLIVESLNPAFQLFKIFEVSTLKYLLTTSAIFFINVIPLSFPKFPVHV